MIFKVISRILIFVSVICAWQIHARTVRLVTLEYPPYEFQGAQDASGIAVELIREVFKRIDRPFEIQFMPWGRAIREVRTGRVDGIFTIYKTPQRSEYLNYSDEVLIEQSISLFALKENKVHFSGRLNSLASYRVGVMHKVSYGAQIDQALENDLFDNLVVNSSGKKNFELLLAQKVDVVISNKLGGMEIVKQLGIANQVYELPSYSYEIPSYIAFSKNKPLQTLKAQVDQALRSMKEDGTYQRILSEYLKHYKNEDSIYDTSPQSGKEVEERS